MITRYPLASAFLAAAGPFLAEREAEHNLMFGITSNLLLDEERGVPTSPAPYFATVHRGDGSDDGGVAYGQIVAATLMTPPWQAVISCIDDPMAIDAIVADLGTFDPPAPGVLGPVDVARAFARKWCEPRDLVARRAVAERIYRLEHVITPVGVAGGVRIATRADRDLLIEWVRAFMVEALGRPDDVEARSMVDRGLELGSRTFYLWETEGRAVSVAGVGGRTPNGIRIGPVYTPPGWRGHGFASAVTAAASQAALDAGRRFVFLFTDLANPTSNRIYQAIGYEAVIDVDLIRFGEP